jgi:meso-butanediol dehydrogenase / (S,S)-butanediol dehydrogenase / diacetyl reductase
MTPRVTRSVGHRFAGLVAVVTGGTSGIGLATARRLHAEGASVVIAGRRIDAGEAAVASFAPDRVQFCSTDVTDRGQLDRLFARTVETFGRLDVVVNSAGSAVFGPVESLQPKHWQRLIDLNLTALFETCQVALPHLRATIAADKPAGRFGGAAIVNVASLTAVAGEPGMAAYAAAKAGALNFTRSLALELARDGIRVNAVSPGAVDTPLSAATTGDPRIAAVFNDAIPLGRFGQPDEIAAAIAFLAAPEASFITGANLMVDGGVTAGTGHPNLMRLLGATTPSTGKTST